MEQSRPDNPITILAEADFRGRRIRFGIKRADRRAHMYIIGKTGTGKSTLIANLALQDLQNGEGFGLLDPHGDLVERVLKAVPPKRENDVLYFNVPDAVHPTAFNPLDGNHATFRPLVASDLISVFKKIWADSWGPRTEYILRNILLALLELPDSTLLDVPRLLDDPAFRRYTLAHIRNPQVRYFWSQEYANYPARFRAEAIAPIQNKVGEFLVNPILRRIVGQPKSAFDLRHVMDEGRVLVVNLAKGKIGEDTAALLGAMLVTKIGFAALSRSGVPESDRRDFFLYVDEFPSFTTESFAGMLSEMRKYRVGLVLAHQYLEQLDDKIRNAILGNAGTIIMFPSSAQDARCLKSELGSYEVEDLTDLSAQEHEALCRPPTKSSDTFKLKTMPPPTRPAPSFVQVVMEHSRATYGRPFEPRPARPPVPPTKPSELAKPRTAQPVATAKVPSPPAEGVSVSPADREQLVHPEQVSAEQLLARTLPTEPSPGRGGMEHKSLQYLIRNAGQSYGYQVTVEKQILGGAGSVDVALEKGELSIACQVCVTTGAEYEVKSIQKCLDAGFSAVVLISNSRKTLNKARDLLAAAVPKKAENRVRLLAFEDLNAFLAELKAAGEARTDTVRGRKVTVTYKALPKEEEELRSQAIYQVVADSFRRLGRI